MPEHQRLLHVSVYAGHQWPHTQRLGTISDFSGSVHRQFGTESTVSWGFKMKASAAFTQLFAATFLSLGVLPSLQVVLACW
eukprot:8111528-Karenia_brevis.AAC.1